MNTNDFTATEITLLRRGAEMMNDMMNDDLLSALWIQPGETKCYSSDELKAIRDEIEENMDELAALKSAIIKLGGSVNSKGYSE